MPLRLILCALLASVLCACGTTPPTEPAAPPPELTRNRCEPPSAFLTPCEAIQRLPSGATAADKDGAAIAALGAYARCAARQFALAQWIKTRCW